MAGQASSGSGIQLVTHFFTRPPSSARWTMVVFATVFDGYRGEPRVVAMKNSVRRRFNIFSAAGDADCLGECGDNVLALMRGRCGFVRSIAE